jgi:hypothetical protein
MNRLAKDFLSSIKIIEQVNANQFPKIPQKEHKKSGE